MSEVRYPFMRRLEQKALAALREPSAPVEPSAPGEVGRAGPASRIDPVPDGNPNAITRHTKMTEGMLDAYQKLCDNPQATAGEMEKRYGDTNLHKRLSELYIGGFITKGAKRHCKVSKRKVDTWTAKPLPS